MIFQINLPALYCNSILFTLNSRPRQIQPSRPLEEHTTIVSIPLSSVFRQAVLHLLHFHEHILILTLLQEEDCATERSFGKEQVEEARGNSAAAVQIQRK